MAKNMKGIDALDGVQLFKAKEKANTAMHAEEAAAHLLEQAKIAMKRCSERRSLKGKRDMPPVAH